MRRHVFHSPGPRPPSSVGLLLSRLQDTQLIELSTFAKERSVPGVTKGWAVCGRFVIYRREVAQGMDLTLSFGVLENSQLTSQKSKAVPS